METDGPRLIFRPISITYFLLMLGWTLILLPLFISMEVVLSKALGLPLTLTFTLFLLSLLGSHINIPIKEIVSIEPLVALRRVSFFGVSWVIPEFARRRRRTILSINLGGAVIPLITSTYLLLITIPSREPDPPITYIKILIALLMVTTVTNRVAKPIKGLGIAVPTFIPPLTTALTSLILYSISAKSNPFIIAYVSGTVGTLLGADLLNLDKIPKLGAPIVSVGGAGIFDGIYLTGIISTILVLILI
ncbi:MAG: DUF1614 domain-containing protein [Candidatus Bathyarchaeia archaeon]